MEMERIIPETFALYFSFTYWSYYVTDTMGLYLKIISSPLSFIFFLEYSSIFALPHLYYGYTRINLSRLFLPSKYHTPVSQKPMTFSEVMTMARTIPETFSLPLLYNVA